jgi:glycosyltransferase involved in cell wall biosynthesis
MNAVDESLFAAPSAAPAEAPARKPGFVMMYHGTLTKIYGLDLAIEAFAKVKERLADAEFWILGRGPQKDELQALAVQLGLSARIKFLGNVRPDEISAWLTYTDIGVLATRRDAFLDLSFSNKLSEYIIMRKAVLCSNLRSIRSYFSDNALQYFEANRSDDLAKQMLRLYEDAKLRRSLAERALIEYHPIRWEVMSERYRALVAALVAAEPQVTRSSPLLAKSS